MNIQYYGHSCFKLTTKPSGRATEEVTVFFDPFDKAVGLRPPQGAADIVFVSHQHHDHNNVEALKGDPIVIDTPGEYAVKGINAIGLDTFHDSQEGKERGRNTIFILESEGIRLCHLGDLGTDLTPAQLDEINGVDVLFIPVGGNYTIDGKKAAELIRKIEPAIAIPMHYRLPGSTVEVSDENIFCNEISVCKRHESNRITFKKTDLEGKNGEVIVLGIEQ